MCIELANGYKLNRKLVMISCKKCGRTWQVTEKSAKHFNEDYNGICPNCCSVEERKAVSLLKRKTNNDRINEMSVEEKAEFLTKKTKCVFCDDEVMQEQADCSLLKSCTEYSRWKQWLESEVEE